MTNHGLDPYLNGTIHERGEDLPPLPALSSDDAALTASGAHSWHDGRDDEETPVPETLTAAAGDPAPTMQAGDPAPPVQDADPTTDGIQPEVDDKFHGVCFVEDLETGDGRVALPGAIETWRDLPLSLGWQPADQMGHDGAVICGRIERFERRGNVIWYEGTWDLDGIGWETQRLVGGQFLRGISVDLDDCEVALVNPDGTAVDPMDAMFGGADDAVVVITRARIATATLCRVPALQEAFVANGPMTAGAPETPAEDAAPVEDDTPVEEPMPEEEAAALVASAGRKAKQAVDTRPPASAYADPQFTPGDGRMVEFAPGKWACPLTITPDGRIFGHVAAWGECHVGFPDTCITPPFSESGYAWFTTGLVECSDGSLVPVGQMTMGTGHADDRVGLRPAASHYDNTGSAVADLALGEDAYGPWYAGTLRAGVTEDEIRELRAAGVVSGDWREQPRGSNQFELIAVLAVNVGGFTIPRVTAGLQGGRQVSLVAAGHLPPRPSSSGTAMGGVNPDEVARLVVARLDRRDRIRRVAASMGQDPRTRVAVAASLILERD